MKLINILIGLLILHVSAIAQNVGSVLGPEQVMDLIRKNHPIAKQAYLQLSKASAELMSSRGGFDPVFDIEADRKTFDGKNYYYRHNPEIIFPTPIGITVKSGLENNGGENLFSENTKGYSSYFGIELPLGNGLLFDKRRAALQQAKIFSKQSEQEKRRIINDLMLDAYSDYWQWAGAFKMYHLYADFIINAENRLKLVKNAYQNGDRSLMDTLESFIQLQQYRLLQSDAISKLNTAALELSNYLWSSGDSAYLITSKVLPDTIQFSSLSAMPNLDEMIAKLDLMNPYLQSASLKINSLETERRLKFQNLLPYVSVKTNILSKDYSLIKGWDASYLENNYKWGISFNMPLLFRQGRGEYIKSKIKVNESKLELANKRWLTETKIRTYYNELAQLLDQIKMIKQMQVQYRTLLRNEELKYVQGESSLFLVNSRETKILELFEKQVGLMVKYQTTYYKLKWVAGLLQ